MLLLPQHSVKFVAHLALGIGLVVTGATAVQEVLSSIPS